MRRMSMVAALATATALMCVPLALAASSPTVGAGATTGIGDSTATLHGTVNPNGLSTTSQFSYGLTSALGQLSPVIPANAGAGTVPVTESTKLNGLLPDTTYYYVLVAKNNGGTSTTPLETFKTTGNPIPAVTTGPATGISRYAATLVGTINPNNQVTTYYFQYGLTTSYGLQTAVQAVSAGLLPLTVTYALPGIAPGTTFHYRLLASHGAATSYGHDVTFMTPPWPRLHTQLSLVVRPLTKPARNFLAVSGRIRLPRGTPASLGCSGAVTVSYYADGRQLRTGSAAIAPNCSYGTVTRIRYPAGTFVTVRARYRGDAYLAPTALRSALVALG
jgi:hypothetical protein